MSKQYIVYWSGTGNTKEMAKYIGEGVTKAGGDPEVVEVSSFSADRLKDIPAFALGCPSMGDEVLEEDEMEPFVAAVEGLAKGKKIGLFGSYGWGNCEWMRNWEDRLVKAGAEIIDDEGITVLGEADDETKDKLIDLGKKLAEM
jgi:flavodoxin short chain